MVTLKFDTNVFFTADHHFGHANIIRFENRPFKDLKEMNEEMIRRWNSVVKDEVVFILGDFCLSGKGQWRYLLERLNGRKYLIEGNHDKSIPEGFEKVTPMMNLLVGEQRITLCHYPMLSWYLSGYGSWQLHGHIHSKPDPFPHPNRFNVSVEMWDYYPVSFEQLLKESKIREWSDQSWMNVKKKLKL